MNTYDGPYAMQSFCHCQPSTGTAEIASRQSLDSGNPHASRPPTKIRLWNVTPLILIGWKSVGTSMPPSSRAVPVGGTCAGVKYLDQEDQWRF